MAGIKHTYTHTIKDDAGATVIADVIVITADTEENFNVTVPAASSVDIALSIPFADIQSFFVEMDQAGSFKVNTTAETHDLVAKVALWWNTQQVNACPITHDITLITMVNPGAVAATAKGGFLVQQ